LCACINNVSGVVVAGGLSRRLGHDKRRLRLWGPTGPTLLEHTLGVLAPLCADLLVVLNDAAAWPALPARVVGDVYADGGALGGIYAGLAAAHFPVALVVAADMPLLNAHLLRAMLAHPLAGDALVPRTLRTHPGAAPGTPAPAAEPLHALYRRACLPTLEKALDAGTRRIGDVLGLLRVDWLEPPDVARHDPAGHSFLNLNTPADLAYVQRVLAASAP
jgi:molybdopterin-guanine dinucleotide biosynthesis protein A